MGRTLKRVPLDFDWPLNEIWKGYINPRWNEVKECHSCDTGYTPARKRLHTLVYLLMMSSDDALNGKNHPWTQNLPLDTNKKMDYAEISALTSGLADRKHEGGLIGHDAIDNWHAERKIIEAAGLDPKDWGLCKVCEDSEGYIYPEGYDHDFEDYEPPQGEGFQLWETTSEGSPTSPVFKTLDELCEWAEKNATTFGYSKATKEKWKEMLEENLVYHESGNSIFM